MPSPKLLNHHPFLRTQPPTTLNPLRMLPLQPCQLSCDKFQTLTLLLRTWHKSSPTTIGIPRTNTRIRWSTSSCKNSWKQHIHVGNHQWHNLTVAANCHTAPLSNQNLCRGQKLPIFPVVQSLSTTVIPCDYLRPSYCWSHIPGPKSKQTSSHWYCTVSFWILTH